MSLYIYLFLWFNRYLGLSKSATLSKSLETSRMTQKAYWGSRIFSRRSTQVIWKVPMCLMRGSTKRRTSLQYI